MQHPSRIICVLETHHKVVRVSHDDHSTSRLPLPPVVMDPQIQHIMQKDIGQQRADDSPNAKDDFAFERRLRFRQKSSAD
jgi:hypothetical protein